MPGGPHSKQSARFLRPRLIQHCSHREMKLDCLPPFHDQARSCALVTTIKVIQALEVWTCPSTRTSSVKHPIPLWDTITPLFSHAFRLRWITKRNLPSSLANVVTILQKAMQ